jgi:polysaccharide chain length determinant protein (PEP-CTERM system associated)
MIASNKVVSIEEIYEVFLKRFWYIIIPLVISMVAVTVYAVLCPRTYRASTTILVTPQQVPVDYVRPTVTARIEDRLHSISQEIMSRTRLEQVISGLKLYTDEVKALKQEEIIEKMRKDTSIKIGSKEGYFSITYEGKNAEIVATVANKLASLFIEENLRLREQQAVGTTEFIANELKNTREKLDEQDKILTDFKKKHIYELPDRLQTNLTMLGQLQTEHQRISDSLKAAQDRRLVIQRQFAEQTSAAIPEIASETPQISTVTAASYFPGPPVKKAKSSKVQQIEQLQNLLLDSQTKYTDKHPDILLTKKKIADLQRSLKNDDREEMEESANTGGGSIISPLTNEKTVTLKKEKAEPPKTLYLEMKAQLGQVDLEIKRLREEEAGTKAKIANLQQRIENTPARELAMATLSREYQNTKQSYEGLLGKSQSAQQAENLERRQKGEQFKIIDPARVPEKPFKPNIPAILLIGLVLGLGSGVGLALFKEFLDRSFKNPEDLETTLGLRVLANIPKIMSKPA